MITLSKKLSANEPEPIKEQKLSLEEATTYLKKIKEWESASKFDRETIISWANFLKNKGVTN